MLASGPRHTRWLGLIVLLAACGSTTSSPPPQVSIDLPMGDPDGGAVAGFLGTSLQGTAGGRLFVGAYETDGGVLVCGASLGEVALPLAYQLLSIPGGPRIIRARLDLPPYSLHPLTEAPGGEDATGVYLNRDSIVPVAVRPGAVTGRVDFSIER